MRFVTDRGTEHYVWVLDEAEGHDTVVRRTGRTVVELSAYVTGSLLDLWDTVIDNPKLEGAV